MIKPGLFPIAMIHIAAVLVLAALLPACGLKAPPQPPVKEGVAVASPTDLAYTLDNERIILTWTHAVDPVTAKIPPEGFKIFLATKEPGGCEGCPFIFEEIGTAAMPEMSFQHPYRKGIHHYFRVQAVGPDEMVSKFSQTLYIDAE